MSVPEANATLAARLDRAQLGEKTRVHALAKMIGLSSRELVDALAELGLKKVAQSSLSREEANRVLDAAAAAPAADKDEKTEEPKKAKRARRAKKTTKPEKSEKAEKTEKAEAAEERTEGQVADSGKTGDTADEATETTDDRDDAELANIRVQVENNVANEINQIERKVDDELKDKAAGRDADSPVFLSPGEEADSNSADKNSADSENDSSDDNSDNSADNDSDSDAEDNPDAEDDAGQNDDAPRSRRSSRRRRGRRGTGRGRGRRATSASDNDDHDDADTDADAHAHHAESAVEHALDGSEGELPDEPVALKGSTRLEAKRRRRSERREEARQRRHVLTEEEFLARRESVKREMVVRERTRSDHPGTVVQVGVLEDEMLVEHFVTSETQSTIIGNLYLGRVQNVLPSMEAAFIDIGQGRNGVLYASEVDWRSAGLGGRSRRIEQALKSGDQIVVQVTKDPVGHKGARLTTQISLAGRFLVYVPGGRSAGISRKLPVPERKRLKQILRHVMPEHGGAIIRTAAENVPEEAIAADVRRLHRQWEDIQEAAKREKKSRGSRPVTLYEEPDMLVKVVRDLFNEDFTRLIVDGERSWNTVQNYVHSVAPDLEDRLERFDRREHGNRDAFEVHRIDEQLQKALGRVVFLPSGGSLVIDRTEAMTVIDVNTGRFTGSGGNLEETVTRNNLEAAEEIVRQLRLRDIGGMIVVDFIDMVLPENRDLVLRRLTEALGRDRTRHQVSEVTSLGLVQLTRKRLGTGLLETFSTRCECCDGRGIILHEDPVEEDDKARRHEERDRRRHDRDKGHGSGDPRRKETKEIDDAAHDGRPSRRRRGRGAGRASDEELEKLAASVVAGGDEAAGDEAPERDSRGSDDSHEEREGRGSRARRGRRGRRGRGRGRGRERSADRTEERGDAGVEEITRIVDHALSQADAEDPDEPSGADYETALEEFEKSPRRRRRTRGNSRSDHRPRREDFTEEPEPEHREPGHGAGRGSDSDADSDAGDSAEDASSTETKVVRGRRGRRGRRAVRRTTRRTEREPDHRAEPKRKAEPAREEPRRESGAQHGRRRGRRRATRRRG
nr:translation initiation factor IF-2 N-terminal domain-containing protein [Corynebacterium frankenforstense]